MRKLIFLLAAFIVFAVNAESQTRTLPSSGSWSLSGTRTYYKFSPSALESAWLINGSTYDTIVMNFTVDKPNPLQWYAVTKFAQNAGVDTTVTWRIYGKVSEDESYSLLQSTTYTGTGTVVRSLTSATLPNATALFDTTAISTDSLGYYSVSAYPNTYQFMRYFQFMYIIAGNDLVGTGVKILDVELKIPD